MSIALRYLCNLVLTISFVTLSGCNPPQFSQTPNGDQGPGNTGPANQTGYENTSGYTKTNPGTPRGANPNGQIQPPVNQQYSKIKVASFNIQMFGKTKMSKPVVMEHLVDIAQKFDILAIQELRDIDQQVIPEFLQMINEGGGQFAAAVGPRQGYVVPGEITTYFEQTVFIYDTNKVELLSQPYAAYDPTRVMHRPPFVGHFRCLAITRQQAFSFVLMNVHIAPENVAAEFQALEQIIPGIRNTHQTEDDFILLGDLNAETQEMQPYVWMQKTLAAIPPHWKTTTTEKRSIDNILFDPDNTIEFTNESGVVNLMSEYSITRQEAQLISDHMPVWAAFSTMESASASITQGPQGVRR